MSARNSGTHYGADYFSLFVIESKLFIRFTFKALKTLSFQKRLHIISYEEFLKNNMTLLIQK